MQNYQAKQKMRALTKTLLDQMYIEMMNKISFIKTLISLNNNKILSNLKTMILPICNRHNNLKDSTNLLESQMPMKVNLNKIKLMLRQTRMTMKMMAAMNKI